MLGRPIRCRQCRIPFRVKENGVTRLYSGVQQPAYRPATKNGGTRRIERDESSESGGSGGDKPTKREQRAKDHAEKTKRLRKMSSNLKELSAAALQSHGPAEPEPEAKPATRRIAAAQQALKESGVRMPVSRMRAADGRSLSGTSAVAIEPRRVVQQRRQRTRSKLFMIVAGALIVLVLVAILFSGSEPSHVRSTMETYGDWGTESVREIPPVRFRAQVERTWLQDPAMPVLTSIAGFSVTSTIADIPAAAQQTFTDVFADMVPNRAVGGYCEAQLLQQANGARIDKSQIMSIADVRDAIELLALPEPVVNGLALALEHHVRSPNGNPLAGRLLEQGLPAQIAYGHCVGTGAEQLLFRNEQYIAERVAFSAAVLVLIDSDTHYVGRVLTIETAAHPADLPATPGLSWLPPSE